MIAIAVDDEIPALKALESVLKELSELDRIVTFDSSEAVLHWLENNEANVAFLDINMDNVDGLILATYIKIKCPKCAIVFVTGYSEYALQAIQIRASGYLMKPVRREDVQRELNYIKTQYPPSKRDENQMKVQCFGNFEIFIEGQPVQFQYHKTKEMFAYLIDRRGTWCSNGELIAILWEDSAAVEKRSSYLRDLKSDLITVLKAAGYSDIIIKRRGMLAVVSDKVTCDYYDWLNGDIAAVNKYRGEYMAQYSWGEVTLGGIEKILKNT